LQTILVVNNDNRIEPSVMYKSMKQKADVAELGQQKNQKILKQCK